MKKIQKLTPNAHLCKNISKVVVIVTELYSCQTFAPKTLSGRTQTRRHVRRQTDTIKANTIEAGVLI